MTHALVAAMKLAGSTTDAAAIRAKFNDAIVSMPKELNAGDFRGVDAVGGTMVDPVVVTVEGGKIKQVSLSDLMK